MCSSHSRGLECEDVVLNYFSKQYDLLTQRGKTPFGEVDLILKHQSNNKILVIEVKSISNRNLLSFRVTRNQKQRLSRSFLYLIQKYHGYDLEFVYAFVDLKNRVEILPLEV